MAKSLQLFQEPYQTYNGYVQPGEVIEAKIAREAKGSRLEVWSRRVYLGYNSNGHIVISHPGKPGELPTTLMINRIKKI